MSPKNLVVQQIEVATEKGWYGCCEFDNLNFVQYTKRNTAIKKSGISLINFL